MKPAKKLTRKEQGQLTRQKLFDSALSLLEENDFKDITINDIVTRAGVSIGSFYMYYPSKLDVYYQTYVFADAYFADKVAHKVTSGSTLERLLAFFKEYAVYNADYTSLKLTKILYNSDNHFFNRTDNGTGMRGVLHTVVSYGLRQGELDSRMTVEEICAFLMYATRGLVYNWCIQDGGFDLHEAMPAFILRLYKGIRNDAKIKE